MTRSRSAMLSAFAFVGFDFQFTVAVDVLKMGGDGAGSLAPARYLDHDLGYPVHRTGDLGDLRR